MTTDAGRATRTRFAAALALAGWMCGALAQQAGDGGMIVIPGRGESAETALANAANAAGAGTPGAAGRNGTGHAAGTGAWNAQAAAQAAAVWAGRTGAGSDDPARPATAAERNDGPIVIEPGPAASSDRIAAPPAVGWSRQANAAAPAGARNGGANSGGADSASPTAGSNPSAGTVSARAGWPPPGGANAPIPANRNNPAASVAAGANPAFRAGAAPRAPADAQQVATVVARDAGASAGQPANAQATAQPWQARRAQAAAATRSGVLPVSLRAEPAPRALPARPAPLRTAASAASAAGAQTPAAPAAAAPVAIPAPIPVPAGQQDGETIRRAALAFLQQQAAGLPGKTTITVAPAFPRGLAACTTLEPFLPSGARLWGRTTVGVRCAGERPWTIYLQAKLAVQATYYIAARQIAPGETLSAADLVARDGDLTTLPLAVITDPQQAVGATALTRVAAGLPLRQDLLKSAASVSIGQTVRVVASGQGFTISADGSVLNNAAPGQQVRVRMAAGQIVTAIVKDAATVEIPL
ncbi:flagellar biosynthesis protein FlgA [Burkholderia sp. MSMB617WGS]|uniref:flagellar basal body P-ring formation chaperone FlgA n=1 Tax=Burkholderia sp. MSMB617WGS TaxID=1637831 RepID=UPI0007600DE1|nr:flagellar basal body P-ring formation chaperone FlgA [Burkholderia sp. MSMB617WGS]AOK48421.1 flagellar biosynthesis protein FlgA [Burkholderia sp. MSMB617WGS]